MAGTFDILHPGHVFLVREAAKFGEVTVIVSRDSTVEAVKGRPPIVPEVQRVEMMSQLKGVDRAVLGKEGPDHLAIIEELKPDLLILGPDQAHDEEKIVSELSARGLLVEVKRIGEINGSFPLCRSSKIKKKIIDEFCKERKKKQLLP
ncbi:MAG: adenylyltransferase/cytidyltransferase family protein [Promethearchaeota archaeon]